MIHLDTSLLVEAMSGEGSWSDALRSRLEQREVIRLSTPVLYEWLRGRRRREELLAQEKLFPTESVAAFGPREAVIAAELYGRVPRARARAADLMIAACAISHGAALWTLNQEDFRDIPGLVVL